MKFSSIVLLPRCGNPLFAVALCVLAAGTFLPPHLHAQDENRYRFGITIAGTGFVSLAVEHMWGDQSAELTVGTITLRDISISVAGKHYFGGGTFRPFVGLGLWNLIARSDEQTGVALIARAPVGALWRFADQHHVGTELNLNRALAIRRPDPEDDTPPRSSIVPIPGLIYRFDPDR